MAVDGTLKFDTKIDTDGIDKGTRNIKGVLNGVVESVEETGKSISDAFDGGNSKIINLSNKIKQAEKELNGLNSEMSKLANEKVYSDEFIKLENDIKSAEQQLFRYYERRDKMEYLGVDKESKAWKSLEYDIMTAENKLKPFYDQMKQLEDTKTDITLGKNTQEFKNMEQEATKVNQKLTEYNQKMKEYENKNSDSIKSSNNLNKSIDKNKKSVSGLTKTLRVLGMSVAFSLVFKAMQTINTAVTEGMQNLAQYSPALNRSLSALATSMLTLKNSFATAFSPITTAITPALQTLINYISEAVTTLGQFFAVLFTGSSTFVKAKDAVVDYAGSIAEANKEANKALSPIDKLNVVTESSGADKASTPDIKDMFEEVTIDSKLVAMVSRLKEALNPTITALKDLNEKLEPLKNFVAQGLIDFYNYFLLPLGKYVLNDVIPRLANALGRLLDGINWTELNTSLSNFWKALEPFAEQIGNGLLEFIDGLVDGIKPYVSTSLKGLAIGLDFLAEAINSLEPRTVRELSIALGALFTSLALVGGLGKASENLAKLGLSLKGLGSGLGFLAVFNPTTLSIFFGNLVGDLDNFVGEKLEEWFGPVWKKILVIFGNVGIGVAGGFAFGGPVGAIIGGLITGLIATIYEFKWENVWKAIKKGLSDSVNFVFNFDQTKELFSRMTKNFTDAFNGEDVGKNIVKGLFNGISGTISALLEPIIDLFSPITDGVKKLFGIQSPSTVFKQIGEDIINGLINGIKELIESVPKFFNKLAQDMKKPFETINTWFKTKFDDVYKKVTSSFTEAKTWATGKKNDIQNAFTEVPNWFTTKFNNVWTNIKTTFTNSGVKDWFTEKREEIKTIFSSIPDWFKETFTKAWNGVKNVFSTGGKIYDGIKDGIGEAFKAVVNKLIDGINTIIAVPFNKINGMLNSIREISLFGAKPFAGLWGSNPIATPKIPKLATGAVIPPNSEFLAILGDQKSGTNIEAPLKTIEDAVANVIGRLGTGTNGDINLTVNLDGKQVYQAVVKQDQQYRNRTGNSAFAY